MENFNWDLVPIENGKKVFLPDEFDDPDVPGSGKYVNPDTLRKLIALRIKTRWPIIVHKKTGGAVDVNGTHGHATKSYHLKEIGCKAVDWHFVTEASPRLQFHEVLLTSFSGIGVYYDWQWDNKFLPIGFHTDTRPVEDTQLWKRIAGEYSYFLL